MKVLVVFAHPVETSFHAAIHRTIVESLKIAGHEVDDCDLYQEDFDPRLTREERQNYQNVDINQTLVKPYVDRLLAAEALVLCYPVWNYGFPAILKGFFDRVFLPGVSFHMVDGKAVPSLHNIRKAAAITTYGGSRFRAILMGDPPRRLITRMLRTIIRRWAPVSYIAHYATNQSTQAVREAFLMSVAAQMRHF